MIICWNQKAHKIRDKLGKRSDGGGEGKGKNTPDACLHEINRINRTTVAMEIGTKSDRLNSERRARFSTFSNFLGRLIYIRYPLENEFFLLPNLPNLSGH